MKVSSDLLHRTQPPSFPFLLFTFFLFFFPLFVCCSADDQPVQTPCFNYTLDNECTIVFENKSTSIDPSLQSLVFEEIALSVSDVRMFPTKCRRSILWFFCDLSFQSCPFFTNSLACESYYLSFCHEVGNTCQKEIEDREKYQNDDDDEDDFDFDFDFDIIERLGCEIVVSNWCQVGDVFQQQQQHTEEKESPTRKGEERFVTSIPIPVQTCLINSNESNTCCPEPFHQHSETLECVVSCPNDRDFIIVSVVTFSIAWGTVPILIGGMVPAFFVANITHFPKFLFPTCLLFFELIVIVLTWGVFPGLEEYRCGDEEDLYVATEQFLSSGVCRAQLFFYSLFNLEAAVLLMLFSLLLIPPSFPSNFHFLQKESQITQLRKACLFVAIVIPVGLATYVVVLSSYHPEHILSVLAHGCIARFGDGAILVFYIPLFFILFLAVAFVFISLYGLVRKSCIFLRIQWRTVYFLIHALIMLICSTSLPVLTLEFGDPASPQIDAARCVATHPRDDYEAGTPTCDDPKFHVPGYAVFAVMLLVSFPAIACLVVYWSNPLITGWWKALIFNRTVLRSPEPILKSQRSIRTSGTPEVESSATNSDSIPPISTQNRQRTFYMETIQHGKSGLI